MFSNKIQSAAHAMKTASQYRENSAASNLNLVARNLN